jgi:hypothetical protein
MVFKAFKILNDLNGLNKHGLGKHGLDKHGLDKHGLDMVLISSTRGLRFDSQSCFYCLQKRKAQDEEVEKIQNERKT